MHPRHRSCRIDSKFDMVIIGRTSCECVDVFLFFFASKAFKVFTLACVSECFFYADRIFAHMIFNFFVTIKCALCLAFFILGQIPKWPWYWPTATDFCFLFFWQQSIFHIEETVRNALWSHHAVVLIFSFGFVSNYRIRCVGTVFLIFKNMNFF